MSSFDLRPSIERARRRFGDAGATRTRAPRSDRGSSRLPLATLNCVRMALGTRERPPMRDLLASIHRACDREGTRTPSRATVYKLLGTTPCERLRVADLPAEVQAALYNFTGASEVPAHQVVHACFDHGSAPALSFASGLPWLALHQARKMRGLRPRGRGLLEAVCRARGI